MLPYPCVAFLLVTSLGSALGTPGSALGTCMPTACTQEDDPCKAYWDTLSAKAKLAEKNNQINPLKPYDIPGKCAEAVKHRPNCLIEIVEDHEEAFMTPMDSAVFWAGKMMDTAQKWAKSQKPRKYTLEQTVGGQFLDQLKLFDNTLPNYQIWNPFAKHAAILDVASGYFAKQAKGEISVFADGQDKISEFTKGLKTWWRLEAPTLKANNNVGYIEFYCQSTKACIEVDRNHFDICFQYDCNTKGTCKLKH